MAKAIYNVTIALDVPEKLHAKSMGIGWHGIEMNRMEWSVVSKELVL